MDLEQRLNELESYHDWQGLVETLEQAIAEREDSAAKAACHLRLGRLLHGQFLQGVRALKHFQDAFKLNPALAEALAEARAVYWELGKVKMVQKLLELQLKTAEGEYAAELGRELGNVLCDLGAYDRAAEAYARALGSAVSSLALSELLADVQTVEGDWEERISAILRAAHDSQDSDAKVELLVRASRLAARFAPAELEGLLRQAYVVNPSHVVVAALYEGLLADQGRAGTIVETQQAILAERTEDAERAAAAAYFGSRWAVRHQNPDMAVQFLEAALRLEPRYEPAFAYIAEVWGARDGAWAKVVEMGRSLAALVEGPVRGYYLATAGAAAWRGEGDIIKARGLFAALKEVAEHHPMVLSFEEQLGQKLDSGGGGSVSREKPAASVAAPAAVEPSKEVARKSEAAAVRGGPERTGGGGAAAGAASSSAGVGGVQPATVAAASPASSPPGPGGAQSEAAVAELRFQLAQQEQAKRYHEYVRTLVALGDAVSDPAEKVESYSQAADLYVNKFANQAEAVRVYEKIIDVDPSDANANQYLREMYEKRRDWEKLIGLSVAQADRLDAGPERSAAYKTIAELATERVKKPEVCVGLWNVVLENDPSDVDALKALAQMHERAREYERLADVLERLVEVTYEEAEKISLLTKLGQIVGDRLKDDARAAEAYRLLLTVSPDDRRAQEQLKRRYVALGRWDDLEVFYAESDKWDEFIRVLESNESRAETPEQRIGMLMKVGELWMTQKGKPDRAARAYEKVLSLEPNHLGAAERLIPIYVGANNPKGLTSAIEVKLRHCEEPFERLELLREVAGIYAERLHDKSKAFERYLEAFRIAPSDPQSRDDVERATRLTGQWDELIGAYRSAVADAENAGDLPMASDLRLNLGRVLVEEAGRVDEALVEYRAVHEAEPTNPIALEALEKLYRGSERWAELLEVFAQKLELAIDPENKKSILYDIAGLHMNQLGQPTEAIATYRTVLDDDPADGRALESLDALYQQTGNWDEYAETLRRRIDLDADAATLIDLKSRLAHTLHAHLDDNQGALENYREILFMDPDHGGAREALEGLLATDLRGEVAGVLETIYEAREDWQKLIGVLEILAASTDQEERQVALQRKIAGVAAHHVNDLNRAIEAEAKALATDPTHEDTRAELEHFVEDAGAWSRLVEIYSGIASQLSDVALARDYLMRLASIEERLEHVEQAAAAYERVLELDPGDAEALSAMHELYWRTEHWEELVGVYRRRIELLRGSEDCEQLYAEMARVYEEKLSRPDEAIAAYREVLALDPTSGVALAALDGLFTRQGMWAELSENLEVQMGLVGTDEEVLPIMLRLANVRESRMGEHELAIEGYRQVLDRDPGNAEALGALERLSQSEEHALLIAEILEPLYRTQGNHQKLIGVHEVQFQRTDDTHRRVDLLHQIAELYEDAAGNTNAAFDTLARALAEDPAHEGSREFIERCARATGRFVDLAQVYERLGTEQQDAELSSQLLTSAARIFEHEVGNADRAIGLFQKVLEIDPVNLEAAQALQTLFQTTERYAEMSLILQQKAQILDDSDSQKDALFEAAAIEEDVLSRKDEAINVYRKILEIDPEDVRSVDALIGLYLGLSRWEELLGVYSRKADLVVDPEEKKLILYQVGAVYERELGDVARAIDTYQRVLELDPDDLTALGRLDVLYHAAEEWQELLTILTHESELTADPMEAVSFQYRIAELYEQRLSDVERAVDLYREILNVQPDHGPTLQALEGIKEGGAAPLTAASVLEPVYEAAGEWRKLVSVLEVQVRFAEEPYLKVELLHRIARLHEESLLDAASAFGVYARAVEADSQNEESLAALERLASLIERWPAVAALYDAELDKLSDEPARFVELGLRVAQIYEVQLENIDDSVARYRRVLDAEPENRAALESLDRLFTQSERWGDLVAVLSREAEVGDSPEEILEYKFRLGRVYQVELGDIDRAIDAYREVIGASPEHQLTLDALESLFAQNVKQVEIADILEPLYQASGEWEKLAEVHEAQLANTNDPQERLGMYYRIMEDAEERLMDPVRAFGVVVRTLKEQPLDERAGAEAERLATLMEAGWEQLANAYADILGIEGTAPEVHGAIGKRLARVFEEELADVTKAEETYRYVLTVAENEPEALANLDRIYASMEQWPELAGVLEARAAACEDPQERIELYSRLGGVYEDQLGQPQDAIRAFRVVFDELEPTNANAIAALGRIYEATEQWQALAGVHQRELENAVGDVEEAEIRAKMARLSADRLGRVDEAIEGWKRVLDLRGEDPEALWALSDLYQRRGQWAELTDVLERHFDIAESDEDRVNILIRRARLFSEQLNRHDEALETWQRVLDIDFSNIAALRAIAQIWRERGDAQELVGALLAINERAIDAIEPEEQKAVYRELGKTYGDVLDQSYEASEAWTNLLRVDSTDFEAMAELEKIYRAGERPVDVIGVKRQRAEALPEPEEKIRELLEVADLWRKEVGDYDQATRDFERILEIDAAHDGAFSSLERLHSDAGRWEPLIELYLNRLETRESVAEKSDLLRRIARVFEEKLDDKNQAFDALVNAFAEDYGDDESAQYLERMAQATNRWGELISSANAWLQEQQTPRSKILLCLRLGKWYGQDLGHPEYAQPYYQQIMQLDPNNVQVLRQMAAIHRMGAQWQKVGETLTHALNVAVANEDRKAILVDLGELLEKNIGEIDLGISHYKRALEIDPLHLPALEALERIYEDRGEHALLAETLVAKVKALRDGDAVVRHRVKLGGLYENQLRDLENGAVQYRGVLELEAANLPALRGLERIYTVTNDWPHLVEALEKQLDVVETERERVDVLLKLAEIQEEHFLKADVASQRLEAALDIDPTEVRAYVALERCYRRLKQWLDLINTYERHINEVAEYETKVQLYGQIALVYSEEVGDVDRAIDAYQRIVDLDEANIPALEALSRLYEKQGDASRSIDAMTRVADLTADGTQRVEMYYRIGQALEEKLGDRAQARERLEMALDLDPTHLATLAALRAIAVDECDWDSAAKYLEQEQTNTSVPRVKARLLVELGRIRDDHLAEHEGAIQAYELAIRSDEDCEEAAMPLLEEYVSAQRWAEAEPLAEMLARKSKNRERQEQHVLQKRLGRVHAALGNSEKALKAYQAAHQLDLTDQETIRGIADAAFELKEWPNALTSYQKVLTALGEGDVAERTDVYFRLGCIKREQGQARQAINNYEKALALNSDHRPSLEALVEVYARNNDWKQVAAYKRQILDTVFENEDRYSVLVELGDIWSEKEKNWPKAIEALEEALEIKPDNHVLLHKLLQLYQQAGDWQKMVDTLQTIAEMEERPEVKARYVFTQAQLYRDKLEDQDRAVELFNEALDLNPGFLEAFERINKVLTKAKNWKQLERSYRKMLHRIAGKGNTDLEYKLWHALGLVYRDRMQVMDEAVEAFKMASATKPDETMEHQILAELYEAQERYDEAIEEQRYLLKNDPLKVDGYRSLYRLYLFKQTYDEAWCQAAAMAFLHQADAEEQQFFEDYRPKGMLPVTGVLTPELWMRALFHKDENPYISKIFEFITGAALQAKVAQLKASGKLPTLDPRFKHDPATSTLTFAKTFGWAGHVLGIGVPELYVRNDVAGAILAVANLPPASVAGQTVLSGYEPQELAFLCGKHLTSYRPEHYIRTLFPTQSELTIMFFAGVYLAAPKTPMPQDMAQHIRSTAEMLAKYMQPIQVEHLRQVVRRFIEDGAKANIRRWMQAVELTACRAGLLVSGDLEIAKKIISQEPQLPGDKSPAEKMQELLLFTSSPEYAELRRGLGLVIR